MNHPLNDLIPRNKASKLPRSVHQLRTMTDREFLLHGLSDREIRRIRAAFRLACDSLGEPEERIRHSSELASYIFRELPHLKDSQQEHFVVLALDCKSHPIGAPIISTIGTLRNCFVHPRETFREAISRSANSIATAHNHPSGDLVPSDMDYSIWDRLDEVGEIIGIPCVDHLVLSRHGYFSRSAQKNEIPAVQLFADGWRV